VITVDTSVCHLAGGLGVDTWLLNRWDTCWRWLVDRNDSPWYPTLTQYRQTKQDDWTGVVERIGVDLRARTMARVRKVLSGSQEVMRTALLMCIAMTVEDSGSLLAVFATSAAIG
jgi:hypothetical protein